MALTLNNFVGFETQGLEEASATVGSPTIVTAVNRTGAASIEVGSGDEYSIPWVASGVTDAGSGYVFGFGLRRNSNVANIQVLQILDDAGGGIFSVATDTSGNLIIRDAVATQLGTATHVLSNDTFYFVVVYAQLNSASAAWEWFVDNVSKESGTGADLTDGNAFGSSSSVLRLSSGSTLVMNFDDVYILSGATSAADRFGNFGILTYQTTDGAQTDLGDMLEDGNWGLVSETPVNEGVLNDAGYAGTPKAGGTQTDSGTRLGPSGDSRITGTPTIKGAKWIHRLKRGTGGGSTHQKRYGNSGDGMTDTTVTLTTSYANFFTLSEAGTIVPTASEYFQQGFNVTGAQDITCAEIWAMLGFVPGSAYTDAMASAFETQHVPALHLRGWKAVGYDNG